MGLLLSWTIDEQTKSKTDHRTGIRKLTINRFVSAKQRRLIRNAAYRNSTSVHGDAAMSVDIRVIKFTLNVYGRRNRNYGVLEVWITYITTRNSCIQTPRLANKTLYFPNMKYLK